MNWTVQSTVNRTRLSFVKLCPTGNTTLLVTSEHPVAQHSCIATQLMSAGHVHAEQVGFVSDSDPSDDAVPSCDATLTMAGGEFCGNACLCLAALTAAARGLDVGSRRRVVLRASGASAPVLCRVHNRGRGYFCELEMPAPLAVEPATVPWAPGPAALARYPDAVHLVLECAPDDAGVLVAAERAVVELAARERVSVAGIMLFEPASGEMAPLVAVPGVGSVVWEHSCGSGTASVGAYLAATSGATVTAQIGQPGGTMRVFAEPGGSSVRIGGLVDLVAEGTAFLDV